MGALEKYEAFFGVLANQTRLKILDALTKKAMTVSELCKKLGLEQSLISHNLARMRCCGFVDCEQRGKTKVYKPNPEAIRLIRGIQQHMKKYRKCIISLRREK